MKTLIGLMLTCLAALPAAAEGPPSGQPVTLYDLVIEAEAGLARFRFLMPGLAQGLDHAAVAADLPWLCENVALPELEANGWSVGTVVISVGDRTVPLGEMDPEAVQFFEAFRVTDGTCILEVF